MLLAIPDLLDAPTLARVRALAEGGAWVDGNATSGPQAALAKRNEQLAEEAASLRAARATPTAARSVVDAPTTPTPLCRVPASTAPQEPRHRASGTVDPGTSPG